MDDKQCAVLFREISCTYLVSVLILCIAPPSPRAKTKNQNKVAVQPVQVRQPCSCCTAVAGQNNGILKLSEKPQPHTHTRRRRSDTVRSRHKAGRRERRVRQAPSDTPCPHRQSADRVWSSHSCQPSIATYPSHLRYHQFTMLQTTIDGQSTRRRVTRQEICR